MRIITILLLFFYSSFSYADLGYAFTYKVNIQLTNNENIIGYVNHYTWDDLYFSETQFCEYLLSEKPKDILVFKEIKKVNHTKYYYCENKSIVATQDIENIFLIDETSIFPDEIFNEITDKNIYNLLDTKPVNEDKVFIPYINDGLIVNLMNWNKNIDCNQLKEKISKTVMSMFESRYILKSESIVYQNINEFLFLLQNKYATKNLYLYITYDGGC